MATKNFTLTVEQLKELLDYDEITGNFVWRFTQSHKSKSGDIAGHTNNFGYHVIFIKPQSYMAHRLAWLYVHGKWPFDEIDHINGDRSDNRIGNLREATRSENMQNIHVVVSKDHTPTGVFWNKRHGRWGARITVKQKRTYLGYYDTPELAYSAYLEAKKRLHLFNPVPLITRYPQTATSDQPNLKINAEVVTIVV